VLGVAAQIAEQVDAGRDAAELAFLKGIEVVRADAEVLRDGLEVLATAQACLA
jgi:hypothetical protein